MRPLLAGAGAALAVVALLTGCGGQATPSGSPSAASAPSAAVPTQGPTETATSTPSTTPVASSADDGPEWDIDQLKTMSVEQFNASPRPQRLALIKAMLQDAESVIAFYGDVWQDNPLDVASPDNTAPEIVKQLQFETQMVYMQGMSDQVTDTRLDPVAAQKALSGLFYNVTGTTTGQFIQRSFDIQQGKEIKGPIPDKYSNARDIEPPQTAVDQDGQTVTYRTIDFNDEKGQNREVQVVYSKLDSKHGLWQIYSMV